MTQQNAAAAKTATGILVLANGAVFRGHGCGAQGDAAGEVCFNTAMTGYQEILTDPSYAQQIICFTFPHVGNTGTNPQDEEAASSGAQNAAIGAIFRENITQPASWRAKRRSAKVWFNQPFSRITSANHKNWKTPEATPRGFCFFRNAQR